MRGACCRYKQIKKLPLDTQPMNIALLHNYYQQRGGEDSVFEAEMRALQERGHHVVPYIVHNDEVQSYSAAQLAVATVYNRKSYTALRSLFAAENIDIVHCHNTLPLLSPSAYFAAQAMNIPVVQTLHNYRLLCPNALFFRGGVVCEDCAGKFFAFPAVQHKCYRGSRTASLAVAGTTALHRALGTYSHRVTRYIALTEFAKAKFIASGMNAGQIVVKPNFAEISQAPHLGEAFFDNTSSASNDEALKQIRTHLAEFGSEYAVYLGRLSPEKGIMRALEVWRELARSHPACRLVVIGSGPLEETAKDFCRANNLHSVRFVGQKAPDDALSILRAARFLIFPSQLYETFGKAIVESYACGTPVVASGLGAMAEIVRHGETGFSVRPYDDVQEFVRCAAALLNLPAAEYLAMRRRAVAEYEQHYTKDVNMQRLEEIYADALRATEQRLPAKKS